LRHCNPNFSLFPSQGFKGGALPGLSKRSISLFYSNRDGQDIQDKNLFSLILFILYIPVKTFAPPPQVGRPLPASSLFDESVRSAVGSCPFMPFLFVILHDGRTHASTSTDFWTASQIASTMLFDFKKVLGSTRLVIKKMA
jgi:hypothetical protein